MLLHLRSYTGENVRLSTDVRHPICQVFLYYRQALLAGSVYGELLGDLQPYRIHFLLCLKRNLYPGAVLCPYFLRTLVLVEILLAIRAKQFQYLPLEVILKLNRQAIPSLGVDKPDRTDAIANLGGSALDNEECYLLAKLTRALGVVYLEHHARI